MFNFFCYILVYKVIFYEFDIRQILVVYEDCLMMVIIILFQYCIFCCGFLFVEKVCFNYIICDMVDFYKVFVYELNWIKNGFDYVIFEGEVIVNICLIWFLDFFRKYVYCFDMIFRLEIVK